jgi:2-(1,2-epoxy-1,2-dihydrophenyl)acetyl-CoA isomerase
MDLTQDVGLAVERRATALWLRLDRPRRRNALTVELASALADAVLGAPGPGISAIVLTGSPPAFCSGGDLLSLGAVAERGATAVTDVSYGLVPGMGGAHLLTRAVGATRAAEMVLTGAPVTAAAAPPAA